MKKKKLLLYSLTGIVILFVIFVIILPSIQCHPAPAKKFVCMARLKHLAISLMIYKDEEKRWPNRKSWCDLIKSYLENEAGESYKDIYICPADKNGPCSYAMNAGIPSDTEELPGDLVLLFESAPGWSRVGGAEDVVTDRHGRPGANIAFADGHVEFVAAEDIPNLRWTAGKSVERQ